MPANSTPENKPLRVTDISEFIRHDSCERRFKLGLDSQKLARELPFFDRFLNAMDPALQKEGHRRENEWGDSLIRQGLNDRSRQVTKKNKLVIGTAWDEVVADVATATPGQPLFWREVNLQATVGAFEIKGNLDFLILTWSAANTPIINIVECKSSRRDRTYHYIQVVTYQLLLEVITQRNPLLWQCQQLEASDFKYRVARIDETNNQNQNILALPSLDLSLERADVLLLLAHTGPLAAARAADVQTLPYQLNQKCDGCTFSPHCLTESARYRRLELVGLSSSTCRILREHGVNTIDDLAQLDTSSAAADAIRNSFGFNQDLNRLCEEASARTATMPRGMGDPDAYQVQPLHNAGKGQLPEHLIFGTPLVRVYLCVEYDYVENRIGAISAHVTNSLHRISTPFHTTGEDHKWGPSPEVVELMPTGRFDTEGEEVFDSVPVAGVDVKQIISSAWSGDYATDSGTEKQLLQSFFNELVGAIATTAGAPDACVHFYVWARQEMKLLIEACTRVDSRLLSHLRELLGSRQSLEQLIYSSLRDETNQRYALGWTGRGLGVVTSLTWFGQRYHWSRLVNGQRVNLDEVFVQNIFDFKTTLPYDSTSPDYWLHKDALPKERHRFEIRSRFNDGLPAPYWRACWQELPETSDMDKRLRRAVRSYNQAAAPNFLPAYLRARTHALRWIDDRIQFKNSDIEKVPLSIARLTNFTLGVANAAQAGIDFLRLDHHVKVNDWLIDSIQPAVARVSSGRTLPLVNVYSVGPNVLHATIESTPFGLTRDSLQIRSRYEEGSFVRLSPCDSDPLRGQTIPQLLRGGSTCTIQSIDWQTGEVILEAIPSPTQPDVYTLSSRPYGPLEDVFPHATLDESMSDFIARRVEKRLRGAKGAYMFQWFDPEHPSVPVQTPLLSEKLAEIERFVVEVRDPETHRLMDDQYRAVLAGIATRVHLLQGPPGTGKTTTTATAILARIAARHQTGNVLLISASTHTAVDTLLARIAHIKDTFQAQATASSLPMPVVHLVKVHSTDQNIVPIPGVVDWVSSFTTNLKSLRRTGVVIIGGTTSALLKMVDNNSGGLNMGAAYRGLVHGFQADELIVDEASMLVFPHFLALTTLVRDTGSLMLTGDHRQLPPIVAHDWEEEDRPPTVLYQPFLSAYDAVRRLLQHPVMRADTTRMNYSPLTHSFRLPPIIRDLIQKLYLRDNITLTGPARELHPRLDSRGSQTGWASAWANGTGLYLVLHNERLSGQSNEVEAQIIELLLAAAPTQADKSVAVIAPHRAQRALLQTRLEHFKSPPYGLLDIVDTVNRLQGAERPTIIVSAAMSDPSDIAANAEFILELTRANVAFSRAKQRLIVVCSESLLNYIPVEADSYQDTLLWKALRQLCTETVAIETVNSVSVRVLTPAFDEIVQLANPS